MKVQFCYLLAAAACSFLLLSCEQEKMTDYAKGKGVEKSKPMPEDSGAESSAFTVESGVTVREAIGGSAPVFSAEDEIYLKSAIFHPTVGEGGVAKLDVPTADSGNYLMFLYPKGSRFWFTNADEAPFNGLVIPYSQFYGKTAELLDTYPMVAEYNAAEGGNVTFRELLSAVGIKIKGNANIASVHVKNKAVEQTIENNIAGIAKYTADGGYVLSEGVNFVNLNCIGDGRGVALEASGKTFYLVLAPGNYTAGLTLTVTDMDHKGQVFDLGPFSLQPGELKVLEDNIEYAPEEDLLFFEHFDNFVWGGNVQGNQSVSSYAPDASSSPNDNPGARTGTEQAFTRVGITIPGSAYIQSNWATVSGWTVGERPSVSAEYVRSRNIGDIIYMYRAQEYQGCLSLGGNSDDRGVYQPFKSFPIDEIYYDIELSFDACMQYNTEEVLNTLLSGSGIAISLTVDGNEVELQKSIEGNNTYKHNYQNTCTVERSVVPAPSSRLYEDGWHHVTIRYSGLNNLSQLRIQGFDEAPRHGLFIDNVELRRVPRMPAPEKPLKVLLYNLQYGMWADQANNFSNFAAFIKKYDPDVCVFCEAMSGWQDGVASSASQSQYRLFKNKEANDADANNNITNNQWKSLAAKWGHNYHAVSSFWFNSAKTNINLFPQVVTSKYPIKTIKRLHTCSVPGESDVDLTRGGGHYQIEAYGETINIVSVHLWPFKYRYNNATSKENREGYSIQRRELKGALHATVDRTDCGDNWLIMGDMNSISPLDSAYYYKISYGEFNDFGDKWMKTHRQVVQRPEGPVVGNLVFARPLYDMLREGEGSLYTGPGRFTTSTGGQVRYDMMYGSESMRRRVHPYSMTIHDSFSNIKSTSQWNPDDDEKKAKIPSDHMPVMVVFDMSK